LAESVAALDPGYAFATGLSTFADSFPGLEELLPRIYVEFRPQGIDDFSFSALLDTGGHYCILNEEAAEAAKDRLVTNLGKITLQTARGPVRGDLYLLRIEIFAKIGDNLDVEVVSLVAPGWSAPNIIGYSGALDRFRFAVDPQTNRFFFASFA